MKRLQKDRIDLIKEYLKSKKLDAELMPEILDHLACEAEESLWDGKSFEQIYNELQTAANGEILRNLSVDHKSLLAMEESLNDIVFKDRNKAYGAYDLRKGYGQTINKSVAMGATLFVFIVMLPNLYARLVPTPKDDEIAYVVEAKPFYIKEALPKPPVIKEAPVEAPKTIKSLPPVVLRDELVMIENLPPTVEALETAQPGRETIEGLEGIETIEPPTATVGDPKSLAVELEKKADEVFMYVEQSPEYRGGLDKMADFLRKNIKYPPKAAQAGIQGKVFVQFTINSDGKVEQASAVKGIGFGCDEEAVRVVNMMPNWTPGKQGGVPVRVRFTLPVAFHLD